MKPIAVSLVVTWLSMTSVDARAQDDVVRAAPGAVPQPPAAQTPGTAPSPVLPSPTSSVPPAPAGTTDDTVTRVAPEPAPAVVHLPALKLSYAHLSIGNVDGSAVPLQALHLDLYSLSRPWVRGGFEAEAGRGTASLSGASASVTYGLLGVNLGLQVPGRTLTPFIEGHLDGGVLGGKLQGSVAAGGGVSVSGVSAATWMYTRGLEAGFELYPAGPLLLSASLGWMRSTWGSADYESMIESKGATIAFKDVTRDSFFFKLGVGF